MIWLIWLIWQDRFVLSDKIRIFANKLAKFFDLRFKAQANSDTRHKKQMNLFCSALVFPYLCNSYTQKKRAHICEMSIKKGSKTGNTY
jgi:hypothetical protein